MSYYIPKFPIRFKDIRHLCDLAAQGNASNRFAFPDLATLIAYQNAPLLV